MIEGVRRRAEIRSAIKTAHLEAELTAALDRIKDMPELGQRTAVRMLRDEMDRQENREAIWEATEEQLALPPPHAAGQAEEEDREQLDPDWLRRFTGYAENIGNEDLQKVWGRVLAGEIRKPGSFSYSALRVLAELEQDLAEAFSSLWKQSILDHAPIDAETKSKNLILHADLELCGLIQTGLEIKTNGSVTEPHYVFGDNLGLRIHNPQGNASFSYPVIRFTRMGKQLGAILKRDERTALEIAAKNLKPLPPRVQLLSIERTAPNNVVCTDICDLPTS